MRNTCDTRDIRRKATTRNMSNTPENSGNPKMDDFVASLIAENARLESQKKAIMEEFSRSIPKDWSPEDLKEKFREIMGEAFARIRMTIADDDEKALAFQAAKYVMSIGIGATKISDDNDPNKEFKELLTNLKKPKEVSSISKDQTASSTNDENGEASN